MKVAAIIQARMNSSRLPGKVLKKVLDKSLFEYQIERVRKTRLIDEIVIATTINESDEQILDVCREMNLSYYRGSEQDVLSRYYGAATSFKADAVVRLTSDCPVIDPHAIDQVIAHYLEHQEDIDYVSNIMKRTYPRGMDTEVFSYEVLQIAHFEAVREYDREHVTPFIHQNGRRFRLDNVAYASDESRHRWTVDTREDLQLIANLIEALYTVKPDFTLEDMLELLQKRPEWSEINAYVSQKQ